MPVIQNRSVVCHGQGMFCKGPEGVKVNRNCPFQAKGQVLLQCKTFQEMRRWILDTFRLDEATHDITLRYIVRVLRSSSTRLHYDMLVDILGDNEWQTFVDLTKHLDGSFVLYAERRAKQQVTPGAVPGGVMAGINGASAASRTAGADGRGRRGVSWPLCKHGKPCTIETDRGPHSAGQRFYRCRLFADAGKDCGFTQWLDEEFPEQATKHISSLMGSVGCLEKQVENLQEELDELRRRYA
ncbi:uncharacterized protein LOC120649256 isoform X4 [Panicum virgatum]|nr:uncharacterized protein LOC120649256 isoform X4 [Panicum virgatum]XP_039781944.1 uncharacterized protein LOC120649256 isoform X4 [Panicum virgatum]